MLTAAIDFLTLASSAIGLILTTMLGLLFRQRRSGTVLVTPLKPASVSNASGTSTSSSTAATKSNVGESLTVAELVSKFCPSLTSRSSTSYRPSWWLPGGHLQTFYCVAGNFNAIDKVKYVRTTLRMPDGGTVSADVSPPDHQSLPADAPTVVMAHGLTGGSHESYVRNVVEWVVRPKSEGGLGGRAVVANVSECVCLDLSAGVLIPLLLWTSSEAAQTHPSLPTNSIRPDTPATITPLSLTSHRSIPTHRSSGSGSALEQVSWRDMWVSKVTGVC